MTSPSNHTRAAADRQAFYQRIGEASVTPLWEVMSSLVPRTPVTPCVPALWKYSRMQPWLMESGTLISAKEAERRVLILENPGMPGQSSITHSLYAGLQLILPGEVAPSHRHTQSALRLVMEGEGAYTAVEGERVTMHPGDFIITPAWTWHDHGNPSNGPVVWMDGLDIPMVRFFDAGFAEPLTQDSQPVTRPEGDSLARYGNNLLPVNHSPRHLSSPLFSYPYQRSRETLENLRKCEAPHPAMGHKMQFVNPATGGPPMPTLGAFIQLLPQGFTGRVQRVTDGTVYTVIEGCGEVQVGAEKYQIVPRDIFVVPSWQACRFFAAEDVVLFSFSDRPVQKALGLWREQLD
jgi:gentisate 1,2-dioxygenase